ncbi:Endonuclease/exonuclease/phosphatase [Phakopsora pachyrhizi]|uniref:CCR4-Not complex 3'-5'-exoribonuclease subunit Ccr4 n=1 Tax=Phakopsora pachyrhizi TaxID=170000 RepID=A0AAV0BJI0_PHAPC|nr:Endonuclease/exonuclease/phosphatase [Phakopsora pachyrhizi]
MGGLKLKSLSESLFNYNFLTALYIPHNSLTSLSPLIARLTSLTILDASSNKLTSLPAELGMLTTLQHLFVFDNHLTSLPPELGSLHQLEELGVEGNPLTESLLSTIQKEGTSSLVAYLRDSCPVPLPPAEREWVVIDSDVGGMADSDRNNNTSNSTNNETFTTMCYNILCERYATDRMYGYTPSWALNWDYRKDLILQELMQYGSDIICLQEVDVEQYEDFFVQSLKEQGYEGVFYPKSRARTMGSEERRHVDGCATFFKTSMFQLIERECVEFNQIPMRSESHKTEAMFNRVMTKDNIAVIALLENRQSGTRHIVANVHIHWDPEFRDVKLVQVAMLMDQIEQIANRFAKLPKRTNLLTSSSSSTTTGGGGATSQRATAPSYTDGSKIPTIVCGDFNSIPSSGVYDYLSRGNLEGKHEDFNSHHYGPYTDNGVKHRLQLKSAYSHLGELPFTNYTPGFKGVIDYIWYSSNSLAVIGALGKIDEKYLLKVVGFPNAHFASDHVPVLAEFRILQFFQ